MKFHKEIKYVDQINIRGKRVLLRVDFNVPVDADGTILDDTRIRSVLPTINYCLDEGAKVILISHMNRPHGRRIKRYSLRNVSKRLSRFLSKEVKFLNDCVGERVEKEVKKMGASDVILLENLRFHIEETENDQEFAKKLASLCDVYVNDAFAVSHREHASIVSVPKYVKEKAAGFLMKKELNYFASVLDHSRRPLCALIGGAKIEGKIRALEHLLNKVDKLLVGGGMAFNFIKAMGFNTGRSLVQEDLVPVARRIIEKAKNNGVKLYLPVDCVVANRVKENADFKVVPIQEIPDKWIGVDIGPATITLFSEALSDAKGIIWNGPMGIFEIDPFSKGTMAMVTVLARSQALTIVGGGDTDVAIHKAGEWANISYISTGGGAFLYLLEGRELPGVTSLKT